MINDDRNASWDFTLATGMKTPMHSHDEDVVVIYFGAGTVRSTRLNGEPTTTRRSFGEGGGSASRPRLRGRVHRRPAPRHHHRAQVSTIAGGEQAKSLSRTALPRPLVPRLNVQVVDVRSIEEPANGRLTRQRERYDGPSYTTCTA